MADGQKVFLLFPRRFGKSSLASLALLKLRKRHIHTVNVTVSSYSSYAQFLEKFAEKVLRAGGSCHHACQILGESEDPFLFHNAEGSAHLDVDRRKFLSTIGGFLFVNLAA